MSDHPQSMQIQAANARSVNPAADRETTATVPAPQVSDPGPTGNTRKKKVPEDLKRTYISLEVLSDSLTLRDSTHIAFSQGNIGSYPKRGDQHQRLRLQVS